MTKEQIIKALEQGKTVHYRVWTFTKNEMDCEFGCCYDSFNSIEECEECLNNLVDNDWDDVEVINND